MSFRGLSVIKIYHRNQGVQVLIFFLTIARALLSMEAKKGNFASFSSLLLLKPIAFALLS